MHNYHGKTNDFLRGVHGDSEHKGNIITPLYNSYDTKTKKLCTFEFWYRNKIMKCYDTKDVLSFTLHYQLYVLRNVFYFEIL